MQIVPRCRRSGHATFSLDQRVHSFLESLTAFATEQDLDLDFSQLQFYTADSDVKESLTVTCCWGMSLRTHGRQARLGGEIHGIPQRQLQHALALGASSSPNRCVGVEVRPAAVPLPGTCQIGGPAQTRAILASTYPCNTWASRPRNVHGSHHSLVTSTTDCLSGQHLPQQLQVECSHLTMAVGAVKAGVLNARLRQHQSPRPLGTHASVAWATQDQPHCLPSLWPPSLP